MIKAFATYTPMPQVIYFFREQFGRDPTPDEVSRTDLGRFIGDKRAVFDRNGRSEGSARIRAFIRERELYNSSIKNVPINNPTYRMHKYQELLDRIYPAALETGRISRVLEVMTIAAKDGAGGFAPNKTVNVDNRTVNFNGLSDEDLTRRIHALLEPFVGDMQDMPIIEPGAQIIEHDSESSP